LQIYISNFNLNPRIVKFKKNIFVGHPNFKERNSFDLFIPVKTPGIDMNGLVVRSDGCALVQLKKKMDSKYFKIADLIKEIDR
jgi:formylmethanofuran dehydrogenase subunit B